MISALDISTSALVAQRIRLNAISSNIANVDTPINENGDTQPYQRREVVFQVNEDMQTKNGAVGVKVGSVDMDASPPRARYMPNHPLADEQGNVYFPSINMNTEFVNALEATRAYEANIGVIEVTKNMGQQTLRIIG